MKNLKIVLLMALVMAFVTSCGKTELSFHLITINAKGDNADKSVSDGGTLKLKINAKDSDGIESIRLEIPVLDVDLLLDDNYGAEKWKIERSFKLLDVEETGLFKINITVTDLKGEVYPDEDEFIIR